MSSITLTTETINKIVSTILSFHGKVFQFVSDNKLSDRVLAISLTLILMSLTLVVFLGWCRIFGTLARFSFKVLYVVVSFLFYYMKETVSYFVLYIKYSYSLKEVQPPVTTQETSTSTQLVLDALSRATEEDLKKYGLSRRSSDSPRLDLPVREMAVKSNPSILVDAMTKKCSFNFCDELGTHIGMGFRTSVPNHEDVLITPAHVFEDLFNKQDSDLTVKFGNLVSKFDLKEWKIIAWSHINQLDFVVCEAPRAFFAGLGVKKAQLSHYSPPIGKAFELEADFTGPRVSRGLFLESEELGLFKHNATTVAGYSGAPLFHNGKVCGIHLGALPEEGLNYGMYASAIFDAFLEKRIETPVSRFSKYEYVDRLEDLPDVRKWGGKIKKTLIHTDNFDIEISYVGKSAYRSFTRTTNYPHATIEDAWEDAMEMDYTDDKYGKYESTEQMVHDLQRDFPKGAETPSATPTSKIAASTKPSTTVGSMRTLQVTNLELETLQRVLSVCKKSDRSLIRNMLQNLNKKVHTSQKVKQSLKSSVISDLQLKEQEPKESQSSCKPHECLVKVVNLSRKQLKLLNSITHTRKYQQYLKTLTPEDATELRLQCLNFVVSSGMSTGTLLQGFLSTL
jgi:hypothetical protein